MAEKLKPCPFCGCKAVEMYNGNSAWVACVGCCATGPRRFIHEYSVKERSVQAAIEAWNKSPGHNETIEECAKLLETRQGSVVLYPGLARELRALKEAVPS